MSTLKWTTYAMPAASLGKENPLPDLKGAGDPHAEIAVDHTTITPEESKYMGWARVSTILPYTMQDGYNREKRTRDFKAAVLENEHLRATFLPQLGGRLWSLFDKDAGKELLHVNPVFQPCNLALRNAWISGGVEWNCGIVGHTPFTVSDMACQELAFSDGTPVLRMFQYERVRHLFYRVEAFLPDGAKEVFVRVRIDNATKDDTAVYWWSNMAVDESEEKRVVVPAHQAFRFGYGGKTSKVDIPYMTVEADKLSGQSAKLVREAGGTQDWDISHTTQLPQAMDFFFDVHKDARPFVTALDKDGYGMCQTSTHELRGRKLFVWGMGEGGRHWQTFLAKEGCAYIELQSGLARTQLEHLPMAGGASISWLESYGAVKADPARVHGKDWADAVAAVDTALESVRPAKALETWHQRMKDEIDVKNGKVMHKGMGFAHAQKALLGDAFDTAGLELSAMRIGKAEELWMTLAKTGVLPCPDPLEEPLSYQIGQEWTDTLYASVTEGKSDHWFAHYQLGVMADARGEHEAARRSYETSLERAENPWALRCIALLDGKAGELEKAAGKLLRAAKMKPIRPLVIEALDAMRKAEQYEEMLALLEEIPSSIRALGRVKTMEITALMRTQRYEEARVLLEGKIVLTDVREGEVQLTNMWFELMACMKKGDASEENVAWAKDNLKPPKHLDFRMN
ncbi:MAG: DUF5107 domain-containing protein [Clostridia bacterium]|nr:DUF5107 domain-containing protein [Clostridia bacterium]